MAAEGGDTAAGVTERLAGQARRYSFFQLVQLLERAAAASGGRVPIGAAGPASREAVRLRPALDLAFPAADVAALEPVADNEGRARWRVETTFLGLYGSATPLPAYFTEEMLHSEDDESLVRDVLDLFHHRALSLFYRAWLKYRHHVSFRPGARDATSRRLLLLAGHLAGDPASGDPAPLLMLRYAGTLTQRPVSAAALRGVLSDLFEGVPVAVRGCVPRRVEIPPGQRTRLGAANAALGANTVAGERAPDATGKFRVVLGPLTLLQFEAFLPGTPHAARLDTVVAHMTLDALVHDVELVLRREEIPRLQLAGAGPRLGLTTWLGRPPDDGRVTFA